ncbi:MAG: rhodanese-like domain-containing protein [Woeseiaceae bacterium]
MKALVEVRNLLGKNLGSTFLYLSVVSMAACSPSDTSETSLADVAHAAARQDDRVSVEELAGWLIEGRGDFILIDVRGAEDFDEGRIAEAENIPLTQLVSADVLSGLPTDRMVIVYSNGSENAAKATVMLRLSGIDAHLLTGGFNAWHQRILNPDISADELDGESPQVSAQRAYSCYFVGERGEGAAQRSENNAPFVPPVFTQEEDDDLKPLPPAGEESC